MFKPRFKIDDRTIIRFARRRDLPHILRFIRELADYEKLADQVSADLPGLRDSLFRRRAAEVLLAVVDGRPVGFALFFGNYSTFLGRPGIYLEDLYVERAERGRGLGKCLLAAVAELARRRGCGRLEWSCLDWNQPAVDFYLGLGARPMTDWTGYRLDRGGLSALADRLG